MKKQRWTIEKIKIGFEHFIREYGRLPRAHEIDSLTDLPSSRLIQRKFGGLEALRKELGYKDLHFGKGKFRSTIADEVNTRGRKCEDELQCYLSNHFGEVFVHSEKMLVKSKVRVDFYVYTPEANFAVDIFYPSTLRTLQSNVNIKAKKYTHHSIPIYLISANDSIPQSDLDTYSTAKVVPLPKNISLVSLKKFIEITQKMPAYTNPIH